MLSMKTTAVWDEAILKLSHAILIPFTSKMTSSFNTPGKIIP
jgi:hypothetical protein